MAEPLTTSIAAALASGATAAASDAGRALVARLVALLRNRFRREPSDQNTLDTAIHSPADSEAVRRLADLLDRHMREDSEFADQVRAMWKEFANAGGNVTNVVRGRVHGTVVQARDVQGGITLHRPPES